MRKSKVESMAEQRADLIEAFLAFQFLQVYKSQKQPSCRGEEPVRKRKRKHMKGGKNVAELIIVANSDDISP